MHAVVTGGTKGIGRAVAERLAEPGARLIVNYHEDHAAAEATVAALSERGARARAVQADACSLEGCRELASIAREELGEVHGLVHCAVWTTMADALTIPAEDFRAGVERNGSALLWLVQAFSDLLASGSGVVFITSPGTVRAVPKYVAVGAAKALGEAIVRYLAAELAPRGVRVNTVRSGPVDTAALRAVVEDADAMLGAVRARMPAGRDLGADDVANVVAMLLSPAAAMVHGEVVNVDGGLRLAF
jgi:NAD(P)-dependent dehydrogenase (short-subunit alcohol dehydrogenase family)